MMSEFKRLHPASIILMFLQGLKGIILPVIITLFFSNSQGESFIRFEYIWLVFIVILFISSILSYISFKYKLEDGELFVQKGIFIKKKRYIQQKRVQSIDITAGLLQRMFGLVKVSVETAGSGGEPEVQLNAIKKQEASLISEALKAGKQNLKPSDAGIGDHDSNDRHEPDALNDSEFNPDGNEQLQESSQELEPSVKWNLSTQHLLIAALTSSGIGLTISAVGALFSQVEQVVPSTLYERTFGFLVGSGIWFIAAIIFFIVFISWIISFINTFLKYGNFSVVKQNEDLIIKRGLIETRQLTINTDRVTAVRYVANIFRQPFGYTAVYVESAGGGTGEEQGSTVLLPLLKKKDAHKVLEELLPEYAAEPIFKRVPQRALIRYLVQNTFIPIAATAALFYFYPEFAYYGLIAVALMSLIGYAQYRDAAAGSLRGQLYIRYRKLSQVIVISKHRKIQSLERHVSLLQGRRDLATIKLAVQSSFSWKLFRVEHVDVGDADQLLYWYSNKNQRGRSD